MKKRKGNSLIFLLIFVVVIGGVFWYLNQEADKIPETANIEIEKGEEAAAQNNTEPEIIEPESSLKESSRIDDIIFYNNKPVGYTNPMYSNIVGYDDTIGITMSIPSGIQPSIIDDQSLGEVVAYRLEDGLNRKYNEAFAIFSCFEDGLPKIEEAIDYVDFSEQKIQKRMNVNGDDYYLLVYENFFIAANQNHSVQFEDNENLSGCGMVLVGLEFSEVHMAFLNGIKFMESRENYLEKLENEYKKIYNLK